ncbi:MAG: cyclic nucleotide-binding domain-containing protein [Desulfamplus sp.]|nr:cyclic nucleotide-binding domain-containing protein [Desulfamplus sp.]
MFIDQGDLLQGMSMIFTKRFMDIATRDNHDKGEFLFHEGDPADYFYTLIIGSVRLTIETGHRVYIVEKAGDAFGWSSLLDREVYSASAECLERTVLLKFDRNNLGKLLEEHPDNGLTFYKKLAQILGNRLLHSYKVICDTAGT